MKLGGWTRV